MAKYTINTSKVQIGDNVVGFNSNVSKLEKTGSTIRVTFENGRVWKTSTRFETTVIR